MASLEALSISSHAQVVEKHYYSDGVYQSQERIFASIRKGAKFITAANSLTSFGSSVIYFREIDTIGKVIWTTERSPDLEGTVMKLQLIDGDIFAEIRLSNLKILLIRIDENNGNILWRSEIPNYKFSWCNFTQNRILYSYVDSANRDTMGTINKLTGNKIKGYKVSNFFSGSGITLFNDGNNNIFGNTFSINPPKDSINHVVRLDTVKIGDTVWTYLSPKHHGVEIFNMSVDSAGYLYALSSIYMVKLNPKTGKTLWFTSFTFPGTAKNLSAISKNALYIASPIQYSLQATLMKISLDNGKTIWNTTQNLDTAILHWKSYFYISGLQTDENGDVIMGVVADSFNFFVNNPGPAALIKFSAKNGSQIFTSHLKSPRVGYQYSVSFYFTSNIQSYFSITPYAGKIFVSCDPNVLSPSDLADSLNYNWDTEVILFAAIDGQKGKQLIWEQFNGPLRLPSSIIKMVSLPGGNSALLMQIGRKTVVRKIDHSGKIIWNTSFNFRIPVTFSANGNGDFCIVTHKSDSAYNKMMNPELLEIYTIDSNGKKILNSELSINNNTDSIFVSNILGAGADFYLFTWLKMANYRYNSQWNLFKVTGNNLVQTTLGGYYKPAESSISAISKDSLVLSSYSFETIIDKASLKFRTYLLSPSALFPCYKLYNFDSSVYYGGEGIARTDGKMSKVFWLDFYKYNTDTARLIYKILPAGGNFLYATGYARLTNHDSSILVIKFNKKNGAVLWTKIISSKYGHKTEYTDAVSDTIHNRLFISGTAYPANNSNRSAAASWVLNNAGTIIDTFYDTGAFPAHNSINDLTLQPNGDIILAGQVSHLDYEAATLFRYHYISHKYIQGTITKNDKTTPLANTRVYAIRFDASDSSLHAIDSTLSDSKGGYLMQVPDTLNTCYAKVVPSSSTYPDQLPTYADSSLFFSKAAGILMTSDTMSKDFSCKLGINPGGKGFISGLIKQGANKKAGDPIDHLQLFLMNKTTAVESAISDNAGNLSFGNIFPTTYKVFVDWPTIDNTRPPVLSLTNSDFNFSNLVFVLHRNYLELAKPGGVKDIEQEQIAIKVFPNPFNSEINIGYNLGENTKVSVQLLNIQTGIVVSELLNSTLPQGNYIANYPLNSSGFAPGLYLLKIMIGDRCMVQKVEKF